MTGERKKRHAETCLFLVGEAGLEPEASRQTSRGLPWSFGKRTQPFPTTHRRGDKGWVCYIYLAGVDQLTDLLSCFLRRRGKNMAVDVHGRGDVFVAQTFLSDLDINALQEHDRRTEVSEIMEAAFGQLSLFQ